jgi:hypothetical protein
MQSPTIGAIRGLSVLIFLFLFSTSLIAQNKGIVIKERVEIAPKSTISSSWWCGADSIIYSSSKKMTILVSYGVGWHTRINNLGFSPYGSIGGSTDELFTLYTYQVGSYFLYEPTEPMTSINLVLYSEDPGSGDPYCYVYYGDGDFDLQNTPMVAFGSGDGWGECVGTPWFAYSISIPVNIIGIPPPVCPPGYHLGQMGTYDVQYGETTNIFTETLNGCGHHVDEPPESYFKYELVDDTLSRTLRDLTTGRTGAVLDSVGSSVIEFNTWGKEPKEPETITLKVSSVNGTIDPAIVPINVYPPEVRAIPGKSNLIYGDTTSLIIQVRQPGGNWMPMPYDWYGIYTIMQADTFGFLYNMDSTIMGPRISNHDPKIKFAANPETEPDSVEVLIQLFAIEPCYSCGVGKIMPSDPMNLGSNRQIKNSSLVNQRLKSKILMKASSLMLKQQLQNNISKKAASLTSSSIRINDNSHYGLVRLILKKPHTILLGETKYYQAKPDPSNETKFIFKEMSETSGWTSGGQPAKFTVTAAEPTNKLGVYYEFKDDDPLPKALAGDMIRLIGRYWTKDQTYKVRLSATSGTRTGSIEIEVKKPTKLYDATVFNKPYNTTQNIRGESLDIDALCIEYGGKIGIPPQVIKGQMFQESDHTGDRFNPSYRYEPWADNKFADPTRNPYWEDYIKQPFWITGEEPNPMGEGKAVPLDHKNVMPVYYPKNPISQGFYAVVNWDQYWRSQTDSVIGSQKLTDKWRQYWVGFYVQSLIDPQNPPLAGPNDLATRAVQYYIQATYKDYAQTRKAASYGLIQILYTTAKDPLGFNRGKSISTSSAPEDLNDETVEMPFYKKFTESNLRWQFGGENATIPESNWPKGWEKTWMDSFVKYNSGDGYSASVFNHSRKFYPQSK